MGMGGGGGFFLGGGGAAVDPTSRRRLNHADAMINFFLNVMAIMQ